MKKKLLSFLLSAAMLLAVAPAALAADAGFSDMTSGVWYTDAVNYVAEHNLMDPVSGNSFAPNAEANRAALAVALYRAAGSPAVGAADFTDVPASSSYADAAAWAKANGVIAGSIMALFAILGYSLKEVLKRLSSGRRSSQK